MIPSHAPCRPACLAALVALALLSPARAVGLPPGTEPCEQDAWSIDTDPRGLNVRAEPSTKARVLGRLPPPFRYRSGADGPDGGYRTEFRIVGYRDGWFLIEAAEPPGQRYESERTYPRRHPKPYAGRGWIAASMVGAQYANGGTRMGGLFAEPREDSVWTPARDASNEPIGVGVGPRRVLACKGPWALVESHDGARGWWRGLCSNQVTNCG